MVLASLRPRSLGTVSALRHRLSLVTRSRAQLTQRRSPDRPAPRDRIGRQAQQERRSPDCRFGRVGPAPCDAGPPSAPDVPVSQHPAQASRCRSGGVRPYDPLVVRERVVRGSVHRDVCRGVKLVRWLGRHRQLLLLGSPDRVSTLSRPGTRPGIRPVIHDHQLEELVCSPRFPVAFRPPAFASRSSCSRRGIGPSSRSAYRTRQQRAGPRRGYRVPHA
jgi:hypothetical protein